MSPWGHVFTQTSSGPGWSRTGKRLELPQAPSWNPPPSAWKSGWEALKSPIPLLATGSSKPRTPTYYLPPGDFLPGVLIPAAGQSMCEFKGQASYWTLSAGGRVEESAAWSYESPTPEFRGLAGHIAVYARRVDECRVDGEVVTPQDGGFYGGWITRDLTGP
ncbi:DUF427 domain-containing protein [Deinococcus radiophilus]|uniref:DUF427 domain-containing protein n=1 Tax=Deinococcus radiophilus TaxID=32062 RepID=UPI00361B08CF